MPRTGPLLVPLISIVAVVMLASVGCGPRTPSEKIEAWRGSAVSRATWERVRPYLEALKPGDDLRLFEGARSIHVLRSRRSERPVVVMPAWITSLSGGAAGGASMFGHLIARSGDTIYGSHVFGFVHGDRIVPRYQVLTSATVIAKERFRQLATERVGGIGVLPRPSGTTYFGDLYVVGGRELDFPEPEVGPAAAEVEPAEMLSRAAYREIAPVLASLPIGTDLFSMLWLLEAEFQSADFGETHSLRVRGFLNYKQVRTVTLEDSDGIFKLRPFGWVEAEREVVEKVAVFANDRLRAVVPYQGFDDYEPYLAAGRSADDRARSGDDARSPE